MGQSSESGLSFMMILGIVLALSHIIPFISVSVRRLHDIGKSGWWFLLIFIPYGIIVLYIMAMFDSKEDNEYGANPKGSGKFSQFTFNQ